MSTDRLRRAVLVLALVLAGAAVFWKASHPARPSRGGHYVSIGQPYVLDSSTGEVYVLAPIPGAIGEAEAYQVALVGPLPRLTPQEMREAQEDAKAARERLGQLDAP